MKKEDSNGGYSMIELIIAVAIMAAVMGTASFSVLWVLSADARTCANNIQRSIADCKITTMGKTEAYMELWRDADGNLYTQTYVWDSGAGAYEAQERQKMGSRRVYVGYVREDGSDADAVELEAGGGRITIRFDRASGSFDESCYRDCARIIVQGGSKNYVIELVRLTGKSSVQLAAP